MDCGARREEMDDGLAKTCQKVEGPNRLAVVALRSELRRVDHSISDLQQSILTSENRIASMKLEIGHRRDTKASLEASIKQLELPTVEERIAAVETIVGTP